jgi:hypothetical protein
MRHGVHALLGLTIAVFMMMGRTVFAQEAAAPAEPAAKPAAKPPATDFINPYRKLVPGILQSIDPNRKEEESNSRHDVTELADFDWAKDVPFHGNIWILEIEFKPMRMIWVDLPGSQGQMQRKQVWYMVYKVTNPGKILHPVEDADKTWKVELVNEPVRFSPNFSLEVHNQLQDETAGFTKVYPEKYLPVALAAIRGREDPRRKFLSIAEMSAKPIAVGETVWGIVTWEDVDPRNVWFSVYIEGLTNAYQWKDDPARFGPAARIPDYRTMLVKVLKVNFWRVGDEYSQKESQIRLGVPGQVDYEWVWRRLF